MAIPERLRLLLFFLSGFLVGVSLLVYDEILTLAIYSPGICYPYPLIGCYGLYEASYFPFGGIVLAFIIVTLTIGRRDSSTGGSPCGLAQVREADQPEVAETTG